MLGRHLLTGSLRLPAECVAKHVLRARSEQACCFNLVCPRIYDGVGPMYLQRAAMCCAETVGEQRCMETMEMQI